MRILVLEHEETIASVLRDIIVKRGHEPVAVSSAEAAGAFLEIEPPDAMLLDISLPGMSGLDFLRLSAVRNSGVPTVVVSGLITESQARECLRLGVVDSVTEPECVELLNDVFAYLELRAAQQSPDQSEPRVDRRRSPRRRIAIPTRVIESGRVEWQGLSVNLSTFGLKIPSHGSITPGASVRLQFTLPDDAPLFALAQFVRTDPDGHAYRFVNLTATEYRRLSDLVQRLKTD